MSYTATAPTTGVSRISFRGLHLAADLALDLAILVAGFLVAVYLRRWLPFGKFVGTNYQWHDPAAFGVLGGAAVVAFLLGLLLTPRRRRFWSAVAGCGLAVVGLTLFAPHQSGLEKGYFLVSALGLTVLLIPTPGDETSISLTRSLERLWDQRDLVRIWVLYNVRSRYSQAFLGILWIVLLPLSTALIMSVVFAQLLRVPLGHVPFIAFLLAGLTPWGLFNQSVSAGMRSIVNSMGLINQIYFPREIIVISSLGEALVDTAFMFLAMVVVNLAVGVHPNVYFLILPLLLVVQVALSLGLMLILSWVSVLVRDVPQLVSVVLQILFYLTPIIYPLDIVPRQYQFLITLNPLVPIIQAYHNIVVYDRVPDWTTLAYPAALAVAFLVYGYRLFKSHEDRMADFV